MLMSALSLLSLPATTRAFMLLPPCAGKPVISATEAAAQYLLQLKQQPSTYCNCN
jgi:hypothetical protein